MSNFDTHVLNKILVDAKPKLNEDINVFIFSYNKELTIIDSIKSVINQTYFSRVFITIIDDCSTDKTLEKILSLKRVDLKIIQNNKNFGISFCRNLALKNIKDEAKYFFFLDGDDKLNVYKFEKSIIHLSSVNEINTDAVFSDYSFINNEGILKDSSKFEKRNITYSDLLLGKSPPAPMSNIFYKTSILRKNSTFFFDTNLSHLEDYDFLLNFKSNIFCYLDEKLVFIRTKNKKSNNNDLFSEFESRLNLITKRKNILNDISSQKESIISLVFLILDTSRIRKFVLFNFLFVIFYYVKLNLKVLVNRASYDAICFIFNNFYSFNLHISKKIISTLVGKIKRIL